MNPPITRFKTIIASPRDRSPRGAEQRSDVDWDRRLREKPYQGVLFMSAGAIAGVSAGAVGDLLDASIEADTIRIAWVDGDESTLDWPMLMAAAGLPRLPTPHLVFVSGRDAVGLLFTSSTPIEGLAHVKPHSPIATIGWLSREQEASFGVGDRTRPLRELRLDPAIY